jgi:CheY-specific phosphatase CheX
VEKLDELVRTSCKALFADYSLSLDEVSGSALESEEPVMYCGVIGFTGDDLRGTVLLAATERTLAHTNPVGPNMLRDWMAELVNQLAGRVKNQLLDFGTTVYISTPVVLRGQHLAPLPRQELAPLTFQCELGYVCVWLDALVREGFELVEQERGDRGVEGEAFMF